MVDKNSKLRNLEFGKFAEEKAMEYYVKNGYAIRAKNWRHKRIEIDIIAQTENIIVFVEVKARSGRDMQAIEAVTLDKMRSMTRGADFYLRNEIHGDYEYRYDIVALTGDFNDYEIEIIEDAFVSPLLK